MGLFSKNKKIVLETYITTRDINNRNKNTTLNCIEKIKEKYCREVKIKEIQKDGVKHKKAIEMDKFNEILFVEFSRDFMKYSIIMPTENSNSISIKFTFEINKNEVLEFKNDIMAMYKEVNGNIIWIEKLMNELSVRSALRKKGVDTNLFDSILMLKWIQIYPSADEDKESLNLNTKIDNDFYMNLVVYKTEKLNDDSVYVQLTEEIFESEKKEHLDLAVELSKYLKYYREKNNL